MVQLGMEDARLQILHFMGHWSRVFVLSPYIKKGRRAGFETSKSMNSRLIFLATRTSACQGFGAISEWP